MTFSLVMNCYVFIEIFEFFKRSVETLCNLHNSLDAFICICHFIEILIYGENDIVKVLL